MWDVEKQVEIYSRIQSTHNRMKPIRFLGQASLFTRIALKKQNTYENPSFGSNFPKIDMENNTNYFFRIVGGILLWFYDH
jgi:hypothetical protein